MYADVKWLCYPYPSFINTSVQRTASSDGLINQLLLFGRRACPVQNRQLLLLSPDGRCRYADDESSGCYPICSGYLSDRYDRRCRRRASFCHAGDPARHVPQNFIRGNLVKPARAPTALPLRFIKVVGTSRRDIIPLNIPDAQHNRKTYFLILMTDYNGGPVHPTYQLTGICGGFGRIPHRVGQPTINFIWLTLYHLLFRQVFDCKGLFCRHPRPEYKRNVLRPDGCDYCAIILR